MNSTVSDKQRPILSREAIFFGKKFLNEDNSFSKSETIYESREKAFSFIDVVNTRTAKCYLNRFFHQLLDKAHIDYRSSHNCLSFSQIWS